MASASAGPRSPLRWPRCGKPAAGGRGALAPALRPRLPVLDPGQRGGDRPPRLPLIDAEAAQYLPAQFHCDACSLPWNYVMEVRRWRR